MEEPVKGLPLTNSREENRRTFLSKASSLAMAGGLVGGYGALAVVAGKFLYPNQPRKLAWIFVAESTRLKLNDTISFQTPAGQRVLITRRAEQGTVDDFLALSTVCPHLGCQVHWEPQNRRFFCPCHNGAFDPSGRATEGPPADAGQSLPTFPLKLENGLIFIQVPADTWG
jgi:cytochrome b6-f complex iron-sulfur subunit